MIGSIRSRRIFTELRTNGRRVRSGSVRMSYLPIDDASPQLGFALSRKFGNAVERNRGRRRLRAAFVESWNRPATERPPTGAFLLTGTRRLLTDDYPHLVNDVDRCLARLVATDRSEGARS